MPYRHVTVIVTNKKVGTYEAKSYPDTDIDNDGKMELYSVPLFEIIVAGRLNNGRWKNYRYKAPRFMPYWNDPKTPNLKYKARGWVNAGLSKKRRIIVKKYKSNYGTQNRYSPGRGAIVLTGTFYIHAGPAMVSDAGWGSAGYIEIVGNYDTFKANIASLSGSSSKNSDRAIEGLVKRKKLIVKIIHAKAPNIKSSHTRDVHP